MKKTTRYFCIASIICSLIGCDQSEDPEPLPQTATLTHTLTLTATETETVPEQLPPEQLPKSIEFEDLNIIQSKISGVLAIIPPEDESNIEHYVVYWADKHQQKLTGQKPILTLDAIDEKLTLKLEDSLSVPEGASHLMVVPKNAVGEAKKGAVTPIQDRYPPALGAQSIRFEDADPKAGRLRGMIEVMPANDTTHVTHYHIYWGKNAQEILPKTPRIARLKAQKELLRFRLPKRIKIPKGATHFIVHSVRFYDRMQKGKSVEIIDLRPPKYAASSLSFYDTDLDAFEIGGNLRIEQAADESDLLDYSVYWGHSASKKLEEHPLTTLAKLGRDRTLNIPQNTFIPDAATHFLVFSRNAAGEQETGVSIQIRDRKRIQSIAAGSDFACILEEGGETYCWGEGQQGQLGVSQSKAELPEQAVQGLPLSQQLSLGTDHGCAVSVDQDPYCWGDASQWKLGNASTKTLMEASAAYGVSGAMQIAAGNSHTCALNLDKQVYCWGSGIFGQLGYKKTSSPAAKRVLYLDSTEQLAAGAFHNCALLSDKTVWCWGAGKNGQLGNGKNKNSRDPVQVQRLTLVESIAAGGKRSKLAGGSASGSHSCALKKGGIPWCWGDNRYGQLGSGNQENSNVPLKVKKLRSISKLALGAAHSCALSRRGNVYCWGNGSEGELGLGDAESSSIPLKVSLPVPAIDIALGANTTFIVTREHEIYYWGYFMGKKVMTPQRLHTR